MNVCKTSTTAVSVDASLRLRRPYITPYITPYIVVVCHQFDISRVKSAMSLVASQHGELLSRSRPEDVIRPAFAVRKNSAPILENLSSF